MKNTVVFIGTTLTLQVAGEPGSQGSALGGRRLKFASKGKEERVRHLLLLLSMLSSQVSFGFLFYTLIL